MKINYTKELNGYSIDKDKLYEDIYQAMKLKRWFVPFMIRNTSDASKHIHFNVTLSYNKNNGDISINLYDLSEKRRPIVVWDETDTPFNFLYEGDGVVMDKLWEFVNQFSNYLQVNNKVEVK